MHKGVILLVKANDKDEAQAAAEAFLEDYGESLVWDWYQIGGRWSGTLIGDDPEKRPENTEVCDICHGTGTRTDMVVENGCNKCRGTGKAIKWPTQWEAHGDVMPLEQVRGVVEEWAKDWESTTLADLHKAKQSFTGDKSMTGYFLKREGAVLHDDFTFESNVYDTEERTNQVPADSTGYWAVMVDMHN